LSGSKRWGVSGLLSQDGVSTRLRNYLSGIAVYDRCERRAVKCDGREENAELPLVYAVMGPRTSYRATRAMFELADSPFALLAFAR